MGYSVLDTELLDGMYRQAIINGNFDVWQRGTSFSGSVHSADRWISSSTGGSETISQQAFTIGQTDVPNNPNYFHRTVVTTGSAAGDKHNLQHRVEGVETFSGQEITISFWAKADAGKDMTVEFVQYFGTGGSPSAIVTTLGVDKKTLTSSWQKFTSTVTLSSVSGKTLGTNNNDWFSVNFWFEAGSDFDARTDTLGNQSGTFDIAQVQICAGSVALPFQPKSYAQEEHDCLRYTYVPGYGSSLEGRSKLFPALSSSTTNANCLVKFPVPMRTTPTLAATASDWALLRPSTAHYEVTSLSIEATGDSKDSVIINAGTTGLTADLMYWFETDATAGRIMVFSAEL